MAAYGSNRSAYLEDVIDIPAGQNVAIDFYGDYFRILTGPSTGIEATFDDVARSRLSPGVGIKRPELFSRVRLFNTTGSAATIHFAVMEGTIDDSRTVLSGSVNITGGPTIETLAAATVTTTAAVAFAADANVTNRLVRNVGANICFVGDSNVDAATSRGHQLQPGESVNVPSGAALWADASAGTTTLTCLQTKI